MTHLRRNDLRTGSAIASRNRWRDSRPPWRKQAADVLTSARSVIDWLSATSRRAASCLTRTGVSTASAPVGRLSSGQPRSVLLYGGLRTTSLSGYPEFWAGRNSSVRRVEPAAVDATIQYADHTAQQLDSCRTTVGSWAWSPSEGWCRVTYRPKCEQRPGERHVHTGGRGDSGDRWSAPQGRVGTGCAGLRGCGLLGSVGHRSGDPVHLLACKCAWYREPRHTNPLPSTNIKKYAASWAFFVAVANPRCECGNRDGEGFRARSAQTDLESIARSTRPPHSHRTRSGRAVGSLTVASSATRSFQI